LTTIVQVENLTKLYKSRRRPPVTAVETVSFEIQSNEVVGLLGANGAGKTTTLKCMCGLIRPTEGLVKVDGIHVADKPRKAAAKVAAVLEGNRNLDWRLSARENVSFFAGLQGISRTAGAKYRDELLERFGLSEKATTPARMLSRGMQQKLSLVCALARRAPVLLLDEPTLGLDIEISYELRSYLRDLAKEEHTIVLSSHDMSVVQDLCDRVIVLVDGRVVADDRVANLLELFRAQAYNFVISGQLTTSQRGALDARFPLLDISADGDGTRIELEFADDRGFYDLVRILESEGTAISSVNQKEPNLEQVFLQLIRGARAAS
jgi:ABC-2 type transport system ATP-binding protein